MLIEADQLVELHGCLSRAAFAFQTTADEVSIWLPRWGREVVSDAAYDLPHEELERFLAALDRARMSSPPLC